MRRDLLVTHGPIPPEPRRTLVPDQLTVQEFEGEEAIDEQTCPLCKKENLCMAHGTEPCWCTRVTVPKALLDRIPVAQRGKACVCAGCIKEEPASG